MKIFLILFSILSSVTKVALGIECMGCEITQPGEVCDFPYKCPTGIESCETLVSKVNGNYSIVLSCASEEKCQSSPIGNGLKKCKHSKVDTECYSCCDEDNCNTLEAALARLPEDLFEGDKKLKKKDKKQLDEEDEESNETVEDPEDVEETLEDVEDDVEDANEPKSEKKKKKSKKVKQIDEESTDEEEVPEEEDAEEEKAQDENVEEKSDDEDEGTAEDTPLNGTNNSTMDIAVETAQTNETALENPLPAVNVTETETTDNATNNSTLNLDEPAVNNTNIDSNIQEIAKTLNETVETIEDFQDNAANLEPVGGGFEDQNQFEGEEDNQMNQANMDATKVDTGVVYEVEKSPGEGSSNEELNILEHGVNAKEEDEKEHNELTQSSGSKLSVALLSLSFIIFVRLF